MPTDAERANLTQAQWDALTDAQRAEKRAAFPAEPATLTPVRPMSQPVAQTDAQRANLTEAQWSALTDAQRAEKRAAFPPAAGVETLAQIDARRANMTEAQWKALTDEERAARRATFPRNDAQRAGLTAPQWASLTEAERVALRARHPAPVPQSVPPVPSPPDQHNIERLGGNGEPNVQTGVPVFPVAEADPDEDFTGLPNAPGGRNNPSLSDFDPNRKPTG